MKGKNKIYFLSFIKEVELQYFSILGEYVLNILLINIPS